MAEDVYVNTGPHLTKKVRSGRGGEMEMERRKREDDQDPVYETADVIDPRGTQNNTAQEQHGGSGGSKQSLYLAVAVTVCVGLCLLLAGIVVLVVLYCALIKDNNILQSSLDQLQNRHDNMTEQRDQLQTRFNNLTDMTELMILCESHGFTFGDGVCYYISNETKTWDDSRAFCTAKQADLVTIKSRWKQDFVDRVKHGSSKGVWIGLTDREQEGVWKWVDGTPLTTPTYWYPHEPNNAALHGEDCAYHGRTRWNDAPCSESGSIYWMCEIVF